ncbi:hypothetical protein [Dysgonomonas sp. 520]|uniref:hypothetical protein n=1 Tax=Dysgonomonas sp. 520 TaxID=2302931 RepID=UPI0013D00BCB|nr:hypothetical protein [Dysgonomonas sp. 520]NDW09114.1 hypothetical protein [Dysgonomonas sp. 520]
MRYEKLYENLLEVLEEKIPQKIDIANVLMDMLHIGKEAVYRRLRGEVPFTLVEVAIISKELGVSIDNLVRIDSAKKRPFQFNMIEYMSPTDSDYALMEEINYLILQLKDNPDTEGGEATNILPQPLYVAHENISRFFLFKWRYQFNTSVPLAYKEIVICPKLKKIQLENKIAARYLKKTDFIFDYQIFSYLVHEIKYYYNIGLVTFDEVQLIRQDLLDILSEIENLSLTGRFKETGNEVNLYISNVSFDTGYCYIDVPNYHLTVVKAFTLNGIASLDEKTYQRRKVWIQSLKRQSNLITHSGEKERIEFFRKQLEIIGSLKNIDV